MPSTKVRRDDHGIFVRTNRDVFRPGGICGYDHAYDMSDGGLAEGMIVRARAMSGTSLCSVVREDGRKVRWGNDYLHEQEAERSPNRAPMTEAQLEALGMRVTPMVRADDEMVPPKPM